MEKMMYLSKRLNRILSTLEKTVPSVMPVPNSPDEPIQMTPIFNWDGKRNKGFRKNLQAICDELTLTPLDVEAFHEAVLWAARKPSKQTIEELTGADDDLREVDDNAYLGIGRGPNNRNRLTLVLSKSGHELFTKLYARNMATCAPQQGSTRYALIMAPPAKADDVDDDGQPF